MTTVSYRCSNCLDHAETRPYDVSHFSLTCETCGEFARFVHEGVLAKFEAFESDPPRGLDWDRLSRIEKFVVVEGIVRQGRALDDFDVDSGEGGLSEGD